MIIKLTYALVGGVNFGLEKSWKMVEGLIKKYPHATWRRMVDMNKGVGAYIVMI